MGIQALAEWICHAFGSLSAVRSQLQRLSPWGFHYI
jgi:hypothetical protein